MSSANNTIVELLSPRDPRFSGHQYTYEGSKFGDALMNNKNKKKEAEEEREEVTDDENSLEVEECPICMDAIDPDRNCVTTECGHRFHAKCLFENISRNGFDCPCCRGKMAEAEEEEDEQDDDDDDDDDYYADDVEEEEEDNTDHLLRGMRWMFQRASNDGGVVDEGEEEDDEDEEGEGEEEVEEVEPPNVELIMEKLAERGITFEQTIKGLLNDCHPEYSTRFVTEADQLFGAVRSILANYARGSESEREDIRVRNRM